MGGSAGARAVPHLRHLRRHAGVRRDESAWPNARGRAPDARGDPGAPSRVRALSRHPDLLRRRTHRLPLRPTDAASSRGGPHVRPLRGPDRASSRRYSRARPGHPPSERRLAMNIDPVLMCQRCGAPRLHVFVERRPHPRLPGSCSTSTASTSATNAGRDASGATSRAKRQPTGAISLTRRSPTLSTSTTCAASGAPTAGKDSSAFWKSVYASPCLPNACA
jgi:hypothetical protein